jgi:hypothetical protein
MLCMLALGCSDVDMKNRSYRLVSGALTLLRCQNIGVEFSMRSAREFKSYGIPKTSTTQLSLELPI